MISTMKTLTLALVAGVLLAGAGEANAQLTPLPVAQSNVVSASQKNAAAKRAQSAAQRAYNKKRTPANLRKLNAAKSAAKRASRDLSTAIGRRNATVARINKLSTDLSQITRNTTNTQSDPNFTAISGFLTELVRLNPNNASTFYTNAVAKLGFFNPRANANTLQSSVNVIINGATYLAPGTRTTLVAAVATVRTGFVPANPNNGYQASVWVAPVLIKS